MQGEGRLPDVPAGRPTSRDIMIGRHDIKDRRSRMAAPMTRRAEGQARPKRPKTRRAGPGSRPGARANLLKRKAQAKAKQPHKDRNEGRQS